MSEEESRKKMVKYNDYTCQRIVSLYEEGFKAPTMTKMLGMENIRVTKQGVCYLLKKYNATNSIARRKGSGRKTKITEEMKKLIDERMTDDDETTIKELQKMLKEEGQKIGTTSILKSS